MNHRAPRRAFALRRASGPGGRRVAPRRAAGPRLRLAAAAGCALVSTTAALVSANELRPNFDGVLDGTLRGGATSDGAPAAWTTHDESQPVGWSPQSHIVERRTPARTDRTPTAPSPLGSPTPREGRAPSPDAWDPSAEPRRVDRTQRMGDTDGTTRTPEPSGSPPDQGETDGGGSTAGPRQPADDGPDGPGHDHDTRPNDDSDADPGGDPANDGAGQSDQGQDNGAHSDAGHGDPDGSDDGQGSPQNSGDHGPKPRQNMTGDVSQTAPTSGPGTPTSWIEAAFTRALSWGP
jgi:hypothetical protein